MRWERSALHSSKRGRDVDLVELREMEEDVMASAQARLDAQRITSAISRSSKAQPAWKIALAGAAVTSVLANSVLHLSLLLSAGVFVLVFVVAAGDPIEEESAAGAVARVAGRVALESLEPKVKALALSDDLDDIMKKVEELEEENRTLRLELKQRIWVEDNIGNFSGEELRDLARLHNINAARKKSQVLLRLVQEGVVPMTKIFF